MESELISGGQRAIQNSPNPIDAGRRAILGGATTAGLVAVASSGLVASLWPAKAEASGISGWYDVKADFGAVGDGTHDDTTAFVNAIAAGSASQKPIFIPPGAYKITQALNVPPNTMIVGSNEALGFGCRLQPTGCAAFDIGGSSQSFHSSIENLMIWPSGTAPDHIISIDNSYSILIRNVRIHNTQDSIGTAAVKLLGDLAVGGHGPCNNIIWDNLIVRNDSGQPPTGVLAARGCGTQRFITPCLENFGTLFEWQGGQIEMVCPYGERAGVYCLNCNSSTDGDAYLNTYGGQLSSAASGLGCAIQTGTQALNSYGTSWLNPAGSAMWVYGMPAAPATFHGITNPNVSASGGSRFSGPGNIQWQTGIRFPELLLRNSKYWNVSVPVNGQALTSLTVTGVQIGNGIGNFWARATASSNLSGLSLSAYVSAADTVMILAQNNSSSTITYAGNIFVECGWL